MLYMGLIAEGMASKILSPAELNEALLVAACSSTAHALNDWIWTIIFGQLGLKVYERHSFMSKFEQKDLFYPEVEVGKWKPGTRSLFVRPDDILSGEYHHSDPEEHQFGNHDLYDYGALNENDSDDVCFVSN